MNEKYIFNSAVQFVEKCFKVHKQSLLRNLNRTSFKPRELKLEIVFSLKINCSISLTSFETAYPIRSFHCHNSNTHTDSELL